MPFDCFMYVKGIKGDSNDAQHKEWIEVEEFQHKITHAPGGNIGPQGVQTGGRSDHGDFRVVKRIDRASPTLTEYCCSGRPIGEIKIECCRAMGQKTPFVLYTFKDSMISWYELIGVPQGGDPMPLEEIHIQYGEIHIEYTPTEIEGGGRTDAAIRTGWSVKKNRMV